ncbi:hypothetical protein EBZ39_04790 [bacterium]|nr:hypothetical protein [bacterium]
MRGARQSRADLENRDELADAVRRVVLFATQTSSQNENLRGKNYVKKLMTSSDNSISQNDYVNLRVLKLAPPVSANEVCAAYKFARILPIPPPNADESIYAYVNRVGCDTLSSCGDALFYFVAIELAHALGRREDCVAQLELAISKLTDLKTELSENKNDRR